MPATQRLAPAPARRISRTTARPSHPVPQAAETTGQGGAIRPFIRRWMTAAMLLVSATLAVLYISNAIAVNNIMSQIASLEREGDIVRGENERLRADLLRLMSVERVTSMAQQQLGMVQPAQPPASLPVAGSGDEGVKGTNQNESREQPAGR